TPITSLPCAGAGRCIRVPRRRSSATRCCATSTRWISAYTRSRGSGSACTFEWAEAVRRSTRPGCEWGWRFSHRGGAPTADPDLLVRPVPSRSTRPGCEWGCRFSHRDGAPTAGPDILVSSVLAGAPAPGANGCGGSHRDGAPTADPDILVRPVLSRSTRPGCEWGWRFSHRGGAPTAGPDILVSSVLAGAPAPGANGAGGFRTEAVLLQQVPISSLALSLQEHPPRVRMGLAVFAPRRCSYSRSRYPR